jgi:DNA primase small subunit
MEPEASPGAIKDEPMEDEEATPSIVKNESTEDEPAVIPNDVPSATPDGADVDADVEMPQAEDSKKNVKLENLFADVDSDEEFPSSAPAPATQQASDHSSPSAPVSPT